MGWNVCSILISVVVPLKYVSNFGRSLDLPLINCEIELDLKWEKKCVISEISILPTALNSHANPVEYEVVTATVATFQMNNAKLCHSCQLVY